LTYSVDSFDEVHFGKFASYYLRGTYFFDVHPPLAKLMLAAMGYFIGYDGHFLFDNIGDNYIAHNVPYVGLRALPAFLGAMTAPIVYMTMREAGFPIVTCALAGFLITFGMTCRLPHSVQWAGGAGTI
jgi:dolichyl-phosphate-mannose-protein mannosyltransferase